MGCTHFQCFETCINACQEINLHQTYIYVKYNYKSMIFSLKNEGLLDILWKPYCVWGLLTVVRDSMVMCWLCWYIMGDGDMNVGIKAIAHFVNKNAGPF